MTGAWGDMLAHEVANPLERRRALSRKSKGELIDIIQDFEAGAAGAALGSAHAPASNIRCDYCGAALPSVASRAHVPTTRDLQRLGFAANQVVCPECAEGWDEAPAEDTNHEIERQP